MKIRILGAHNIESAKTGFASFLIDDVLAVDASALTSSLSFAEQLKLKAVLLTHQHHDHIRDIPALGMNFYMLGNTITLYSTRPVYEAWRRTCLMMSSTPTSWRNLRKSRPYASILSNPAGKT